MTRKLSKLTRVSSLAIAAALTASASAQSFLGDPNVTFGSVNITEGSGTTDFDVLSSTAVIDWTPDDNAVGNFGVIAFQNSGTTATYSSGSNFAVLNRINVADPGRGIFMDGAINSLVSGQTGGNIFFYSPSGFVIGSNAVIDVGSLVLSASPIAVDGNGNFITGNSVTFNQAPNSNASITTVAGSQIKASGSGSYVALVAPVINHQGTIRTDTAAALVAAEAATINFSPDGLFDIQVTVGTDDPNGVHVDGGTITRNSAVEGSDHYAYLVAVAKNDAVTMLINNGGSVGFDTATSAAVEDNVVVLSGGYDVSSGSPLIPAGNAPVGLTIDNAALSTDVYAQVSGGALITTSTGSTSFGNNLTLFAGDDAIIQAINGNSLAIGGSLTANVDVFGNSPTTTGNLIRLMANGSGSALTVGGDVFLSANAEGQDAQDDGLNGGNATGGTLIVQTGSNSSLSILGNLNMSADARGGDQFFSDGTAGNGTGGIAQILANGGNSSISVGGNTFLSAEGQGGSRGECSVCNITGGNGTGGQILVDNLGGSGNALTFGNGDTGGDLTLDANGFGGSGDIGGGTGTGGQVQLASGDASSILIHSDLIMNAFGSGGEGFNEIGGNATGGNGSGGNVVITFSGAPAGLDVEGQALLDASASGGFGTTRGGDATGGLVNVQGSSGGTLNIPTLFASAAGDGGDGDVGGDGTGGGAWLQALTGATINIGDAFLSAGGEGGSGFVGAGGLGTGGHVVASADAATLNVTGDLSLDASGDGGSTNGNTGPGGNGLGGQADIFADHGGTVNLDGFVDASAYGRGGGSSDLASQAGDGTGGLVFFQASNGASLDAASDVFLAADGFGGFTGGECIGCGGAGGNGTGGTVTVQVYGGDTSFVGVTGQLNVSADGFGAAGFGGPGGNGTGGNARILLHDAGDVDIGGDVTLEAIGWGGDQTNGLSAGSGTGGTAEIWGDTTATTLTVAGITNVNASGLGGVATGPGGVGGSALGGLAHILTTGGTINLQGGDANVNSNAAGGDGDEGGNAQSGAARVIADGGNIAIGGNLTLNAISTGGNGINGGDAIAFIGNDPKFTATSDARVVAGNGSISVTGFTTLDVHATGGSGSSGGTGGDASAGYATVHALNRDAGAGTVTLADLLIDADATGGQGGDGTSGNSGTDGGAGGSANGGFVAVTASAGNGHLDIGTATVTVSAFGGNGGTGGSGDALPGGNSGDGGAATGGLINIGTESGIQQALGINDGTATFDSIFAIADAFGGDGGGFSFGSPNGLAGNGGDATGGVSVLLVRGSSVDVGTVLLDASATGGDGGLDANDAFQGNGGDAVTGVVRVVDTNRNLLPGQRGTLTAGDILGTAVATGGNGAINGGQWTQDGSFFQVVNSDATIDSVNISVVADGYDPNAAQVFAHDISIVNGTADIAGPFSFTVAGDLSLLAHNGTLTAPSITLAADNFVPDDVFPNPGNTGSFVANSFDITTGQDFYTPSNLNSGTSLTINAPGSITTGRIDTVDFLDLTAQAGSLSISRIFAGTTADLLAANNVDVGDIDAGGALTVTAQAGWIDVGNINAGGDVALSAGDFINGDDVVTTGAILADSGGDMGFADLTAGTDVQLDSGGSMTLGIVTAQAGSVQASAAGSLSYGTISAGTFVTIDPTAITGGDITALAGDVTATGDSIDIGNVTASDNVILTALAGDLSTANINAGIGVTLDATGAITTGDITAFGTVDANGGSLALGDVSGGTLNFTSTAGDVSTGDLIAFGSLNVDSADDFLFGSIIAPLVDLNAPGSIIGGFIDSESDLTAVAGADIDVGDLSAGGITGEGFVIEGSVTLTAGGFVNTGLIDAFGSVGIDAGGPVDTGDINASTTIDILAGNDISTGDLTGTRIDLEAAGDISFADVDADDLDFEADGAVTGGNIVVTTRASGDADGAITLGDITVGPNLPADDDFSVGIASGTSIMVGDVSGPGHVGFATFGDLTTGNLTGGDLVMTLVGGDISTGSITTNANGRVYMADASMFATGGGGGQGDFDQNIVLALDPVATGGSITIGGPVSTGHFQAAAGGNLTTGAIDADQIEALAGGLAAINGIWSSPLVELWSDDIDIGANGGIDGGSDGLIRLVSTNATQALIGDGLTGTGYQLSNAEFGRLSAGNVQIAARGDASAAIDMLIGDLTVTGPSAGSTIEDPLGALVFATGDPETQVAGGVIRIVGDLVASGFSDTTAIEFYTGRFELDAATGLLQITGAGTTLSGELYIEADRIHVASGDILDQLAADAHYAGYQVDLNAPADVQRPDGVIRAGSIDVFPAEAVLVQNTGTADVPAGFLTFAGGPLFSDSEAPAGPIELIINGQLITETGQLTGIDVRDFLIDENNIGIFTDNSTINGCPLTGECGAAEPPIPPDFQPSPGIQEEIALIGDNLLPPPDFGNEDFIDDNDEETDDGATSPIEPPDPLFDTSELGEEANGAGPEVGTSMRSNSGLTEPGDVDDPVSGSGNPALMEIPAGPPSKEEKQQ